METKTLRVTVPEDYWRKLVGEMRQLGAADPAAAGEAYFGHKVREVLEVLEEIGSRPLVGSAILVGRIQVLRALARRRHEGGYAITRAWTEEEIRREVSIVVDEALTLFFGPWIRSRGRDDVMCSVCSARVPRPTQELAPGEYVHLDCERDMMELRRATEGVLGVLKERKPIESHHLALGRNRRGAP